MPRKSPDSVAVIGIDLGKNSFHLIGLNKRGAIVLRLKLSRSQLETRLCNTPPCLIGMEACVGSHHLARRLKALGHDAKLMPAKYVRPYSKGQKNDFKDAEAIAEAVQQRGIAVRQGLRFLRSELPGLLATRGDVLSPHMIRLIEDLASDWRRLDERIEALTAEIEAIADVHCQRTMSVPGVGPIVSSVIPVNRAHGPFRLLFSRARRSHRAHSAK
jgi:transposase